MELALSLEKLNFIKLRELHRVAANAEDAQLADFIGECLVALSGDGFRERSASLDHGSCSASSKTDHLPVPAHGMQ